MSTIEEAKKVMAALPQAEEKPKAEPEQAEKPDTWAGVDEAAPTSIDPLPVKPSPLRDSVEEAEEVDEPNADEPKGAKPKSPAKGKRPAWLPANFRDEQALLQSYKEAQRKLHELARENSELRAELEQAASWEPDVLRAELHAHRLALRAELERALAFDGRLAAIEGVVE
jgi:hypothetical protein